MRPPHCDHCGAPWEPSRCSYCGVWHTTRCAPAVGILTHPGHLTPNEARRLEAAFHEAVRDRAALLLPDGVEFTPLPDPFGPKEKR